MSEFYFTESVTDETSWDAVTHVLSVRELLEPILEFTSAGQQWSWAKNLRLVNKTWRDAAFSGLCTCSGLPKVNLGDPEQSEFKKNVEKFERNFPRGCPVPVAVHVTSTKINSSLYDFLTIHASVICEVLIDFGSNTAATAFDDSLIYNFDCCSLRKIIIHSCPRNGYQFEYFNTFLERLLKQAKRLTTLELKAVPYKCTMPGLVVTTNPLVTLPKIASLQRLHCDLPFSNIGTHYSESFPNLVMLHRFIQSTEDWTSSYGSGENESCLRKLSLCSGRTRIDHHISHEVGFIQYLKCGTIASFPKLESLSLWHLSDELTSALLPVIFTKMTTLKALRVEFDQTRWRYAGYMQGTDYITIVANLVTGLEHFDAVAHPSQYEAFPHGKNDTIVNLQDLESLTITLWPCGPQHGPDMQLLTFLFEAVLLKIPKLKSISFFGDVNIPVEIIETWKDYNRDINFGLPLGRTNFINFDPNL